MHELYATDELRDAVVDRWGEQVAPGGIVDRAARRASAPSPRRRSARGSSSCCGRGSARASPPGARSAGARDPPPPAAVVEVPLLFEAGMDGRLRRDDRGGRRRGRPRASAPRARGHAAVDERVRASSPRTRRRRGRPRGGQRRHRRGARAGTVGRACQADGDERAAAVPAAAPGPPLARAVVRRRPRCGWRVVPLLTVARDRARPLLTRRSGRSPCRCATRTSSASRRATSASTPR